MNTKTLFRFLSVTTIGAAAIFAAPKKQACCEECAAGDPPAPAAALSAKSLYQVDATWTNDRGETTTLSVLRGRPVVLAMFFASCEYACPVLVSDMQRLRQQLPAEVRDRAQFVLVSFDSARDTPAALKAYRARAGLDDGWTLLHGDAADVQELAMLLGVKYKQDTRGQFSHSNLITVLNPAGEIAFQRAGLMGDVSETAKAVTVAAR
jgi:protein SCO1/2